MLGLAILSGISALITVVIYFLNVWLLSGKEYFSPTDALFLEGVVFLALGLFLLLGRGGISLWSKRAAILSALAEGLYGEDTVGPSEIFRRDKWKPEGFIRLGLVLTLTGVLMIVIYFVTL